MSGFGRSFSLTMTLLLIFVCSWGLVTQAQAENSPQPDVQASLEVRVTGLRNLEGTLKIAICANPECYEDMTGHIATASVPITDNSMSVMFDNLFPSKFVVMLYHDEDNNGDLETNFLGLPLEGYGFSNNVEPSFGKPDFDELAIEVPEDGHKEVIQMIYY